MSIYDVVVTASSFWDFACCAERLFQEEIEKRKETDNQSWETKQASLMRMRHGTM